MNEALTSVNSETYPAFLFRGNAMQYVEPIARQFCKGDGLDVGCGEYPFPGAHPIDRNRGGDALNLPAGGFDYVFSSHFLEHAANPVACIEHWKTRIKPGGVLFLYLPHPDCKSWLPQWNREHFHTFYPADVAQLLRDLGFVDVLHSERDLAFGFSVVGFVKGSP